MADDFALERRHPLVGLAGRPATASGGALRIEAASARSVVNLRCRADEGLVVDIRKTLGVDLPLTPNRWKGDERVAALWLGPDEWLIVAPDGDAAGVEQAVRQARPNDPWLSLVDVSHSYTCLLLSGPARDVLASGTAVNLRVDAFEPGGCVQTVLGKAPVLLRALHDNELLELWFRNSWASYLLGWLLDAPVRAQQHQPSSSGSPARPDYGYSRFGALPRRERS